MDDKLKILKLIEDGKITVEEGEELLNALEDIEAMGDEKIVVVEDDRPEDVKKASWVESEGPSLSIPATVNRIDIKMVSTDIYIEGYEGDEIQVIADPYESTPLTERINVSNDGERLMINQFEKKNFKFDMNNFIDSLMKSITTFTESPERVTLRVPKDYIGTMSLKTVSGDVWIKDLISVKSVQARTVSGDLDVGNSVGSFGHQSVSGSGKIQFKALTGDVNLSSVSGDFKVILPEDSNFVCSFNSTSGVFKDKYSDSGNKSSGKFEGTMGNGQYRIHCKTTSGNFKLNKA